MKRWKIGAVMASVVLMAAAQMATAQPLKSAKIGNLTWMTENLNVNVSNSWCYDNSSANCGKYGRLYSWDAAMQACPAGWRLPSREEWEGLVKTAGGQEVAGGALKSCAPGWNGDGKFSFSAMPGGRRLANGKFELAGTHGFWWTSTESGSKVYRRGMGPDGGGVGEFTDDKRIGVSVRCVQVEVPAGLEDMIMTTIKAIQSRDEAALNRLLHKNFGIVLLYNPGAYLVFSVMDKISFSEPPPGYSFMPLGPISPVFGNKVRFEALPAFDCEKWDKPSGIYSQPGSGARLSGIVRSMTSAELPVDANDAKKLKEIDDSGSHYDVIVRGKAEEEYASGEYIKFTVTLIGGKWYLTVIDIVGYCEA